MPRRRRSGPPRSAGTPGECRRLAAWWSGCPSRGRRSWSGLLDRRRDDRVEDGPDHGLGRDAFGLAFEVEDDPMTERRQRDRADVVGRDVEAAVEQGIDLSGRHERLRATWRAAIADVLANQA